jgi:hypothetical protein
MAFIDTDLQMLDSDSIKSFTNFIRDTKKRNLTLVCGAGLSVSAGLPTWNKYLQKIVSAFLLDWKELEEQNPKYKDVAPKTMSINIADEYYEVKYPDFSIPENFLNEDPLILAQLIKNCIEPANWRYLLRKALYGENSYLELKSNLIKELFNIIFNHERITSIMTYNYDDLIESFFSQNGFKTSSIVGENHYKNHKKFPIYHLHGILPHKGGLESKIYLSEEDYLTDIIQPNSWYNQIHTNKLTSTTCLFIGLSFNDPSLKRKLAIHRLCPTEFHYALLTCKDTEFEKRKFMLLKNELLRLNVRVIKYPYDQSHEQLNTILRLIDKHMKINLV